MRRALTRMECKIDGDEEKRQKEKEVKEGREGQGRDYGAGGKNEQQK